MTGSKTATVETLTAEVRVLMVSSRQVTMSVHGQLDHVESGEIEPFGRVMPKDAQPGFVYVIGKRAEGGDLVRSWIPSTESSIKRWISGRSSAAHFGRSQEKETQNADQCEDKAADLEKTAGELLGSAWVHMNSFTSDRHGAAHYDTEAAKHDEAAAQHDQEASAAGSEIARLEAIASAAYERRWAAQSRSSAERARSVASDLQERAQECRQQAAVRKEKSKVHWLEREKWIQWENREIEIVTARATEWSALPLIVLAGLR